MLSRKDIIGQEELLNRIDNLIDSDNFPRFAIIVGPRNSGKKLIANYISDRLNATFVPSELKADDVRNVINQSYEQSSLMCYMWADSDSMSVTSKNAILKVTEEPPQQAYFIITLSDVNNMIPTIISRGTQLLINPYTSKQLIEYAKSRNYDIDKYSQFIGNVCSNPGEIDLLFTYDMDDFISFTNKVLDNIGKASPANALKLSNNFKLKKEETEKYDITIFIHSISVLCLERLIKTNDSRYGLACNLCSECLSEFRISSISKLAVIDKWLLNMRDIFAN